MAANSLFVEISFGFDFRIDDSVRGEAGTIALILHRRRSTDLGQVALELQLKCGRALV